MCFRRDGDVLLFNRKCTALSLPRALLCLASKYGLSGDGRHGWDHAGVVVRDAASDVPYLLEGRDGRVTLHTFEERLLQGTDHQEVLLLPLRGLDRERGRPALKSLTQVRSPRSTRN